MIFRHFLHFHALAAIDIFSAAASLRHAFFASCRQYAALPPIFVTVRYAIQR